MRNTSLYALILVIVTVISSCKQSESKLSIPSKPNIVLIYMDDMGYGDIQINGAKGVKTPNIDRLAQEGINFTDAHSVASTCTPSRFSILTGVYGFRIHAKILPGTASLIIPLRTGSTIASMLQGAGYKTAAIGKWHLGMGRGQVDWNKKITPGPLEVGFNYSLLIPATPDRVPTVLIKNHKVWHLNTFLSPLYVSYDHQLEGGYPIGLGHHEDQLKMMADSQHLGAIIHGVSRIGYEKGGKGALWDSKEFSSIFTRQATQFMKRNKNRPFFLYFASNDVHVPRIPAKRFQGKSRLGRRGDDIAEADWEVGQLVKAIKELGLSKNTLIIFSSDNGPILEDGYGDQAKYLANAVGDHPSGPYKGGKYSAFEGGTRVPLIVYWPGVTDHKVSHALVSQIDLYASLAYLTGQKIKPDNAGDSRNTLYTLLGKSQKDRKFVVEQSPFTLSLRKGRWSYIAPQIEPAPGWLKNKHDTLGIADTAQLYDLSKDVREEKNVVHQYPEEAEKLAQELQQIIEVPVQKRDLP